MREVITTTATLLKQAQCQLISGTVDTLHAPTWTYSTCTCMHMITELQNQVPKVQLIVHPWIPLMQFILKRLCMYMYIIIQVAIYYYLYLYRQQREIQIMASPTNTIVAQRIAVRGLEASFMHHSTMQISFMVHVHVYTSFSVAICTETNKYSLQIT